MDANELGRWTRFAAKGGVGRCVAVQDCVAEEDEDLMFLKDDEIVVLMQLPSQDDLYLGYCEGVVGRFHGSSVRFLGRLKKPVMTKRSSRSLSRSSSRPSSSQGSAPPLSRDSQSALAHRDLPQAPSRMSHSHSAAAVLVTDTSSGITSSVLPDAGSPPLASPQLLHDDATHIRSVSHSSTSTGLESTPRTPADFQHDGHPRDLVTIVPSIRQVESPVQISSYVTESGLEPMKVSGDAEDHSPLYADDPPDEDPSYIDSEPSTRISVAISEGEQGIGLSLLQDFVNGNVEDDASIHSLAQSVSTLDEHTTALPILNPSSSTVERRLSSSPRSSMYSQASRQSQSMSDIPRDGPSSIGAPSIRDAPSRTSTHPSGVDSDYGGDEWDGASDIYDNYRYSRASMASKVSRFSKGSMHTVASGLGLTEAPPLPFDSRRPSVDSVKFGMGAARDRLGSATTASSSVEDVRKTAVSPADCTSPVGDPPSARRIPPPLDLASSNHSKSASQGTQSSQTSSSPLLHSAFHSPTSLNSPSFVSPMSTPSTAPLFSNTLGGAASALRQRLEKVREPAGLAGTSLALPASDSRGKTRLSTQPIVVDDDGQDVTVETIHSTEEETSSVASPMSALFSSAEEKKRLIETTYIVVNQAPPPPYSPMSPTAGSSAMAPQDSPPSQDVEEEGPSSENTRRSDFVRRSIFLPHPHAPKPAEVPNGPMYGRMPIATSHATFSAGPPPGSLIHTLQMVNAARHDPFRPRLATFYGKFDRELASSVGPVPIAFSLEPQSNVPANRPKLVHTEPSIKESVVPEQQQGGTSSTNPIPRPNFFPQAPSVRPRSRSFSEWDSSNNSGGSEQQSSESAAQPSAVGRSKSNPSIAARLAHKPSPLSMNVVASGTVQSTSLMPLPPISGPTQVITPTSPPQSPRSGVPTTTNTFSSIMPDPERIQSPTSPIVTSVSPPTSPISPLKTHPGRNVLRHSRSSTFSSRQSAARDQSPSRASMQGRQSAETETSHKNDGERTTSPTTYTTSLRSKLSLPTLKIRGGERAAPVDDRSPTLSVTPIEPAPDQPTVHVKDTDFTLVNPTVQQLTIIDEDPSTSPLPSPARFDTSPSVRTSSPTFSIASGPSLRAIRDLPQKQPTLVPTKRADSQDVEAHRQRELRWITAMASIPASQARKSKKIRKLLYEGVPASVRYIVWAHVADSKSKRIDSVYTKLMMRDRVPASANIERDVRRVFAEESQLLDGSLMNVLQAYLSMVPDIQYSRGLTVIAGRLLLQSPEEDAFWTFVSMMDSHLRPYFSPGHSQLEVDATLFSKAMETNDPSLAKKIFVDADIPASSLCRPWFMALFLEALPFEHSQRVWDIFLYEGITFMFRVGLAIVQCCKQAILHTPDRETILNMLLHPPSQMLPASPDGFIEIASTLKFKDDDLRKQRNKLDAQNKRHTQSRGSSALAPTAPFMKAPRPSISSISLPRTNSRADNHDA
ncbi:TBC-domain-containing protein [Trametopsis cervina]|nr:TBC-domain-containing protein [Trametopsis cervina]